MERGARGLAGTGAGMLTLECTRRITSPSAVRPDAASAAPRSSAGWGPYAGEQHFTTPSTTVSWSRRGISMPFDPSGAEDPWMNAEVLYVQVRLNRRWLCRFAVITRRICQVVPPILGRVWLAHAQENQQQKLQLKETDHISTPGQFLSRHRCGTCPEIELPRLIVLFQK